MIKLIPFILEVDGLSRKVGAKGEDYLAETINGFNVFKSNGALNEDLEEDGGRSNN